MADALNFNYVIVGAGTAGCLLANRLSADGRSRVLLIEAGGRDNYHWIHIPVGYLYCIGNPRTDWMYQTQPDAGLNGRQLRYPRGKVLGGCSSINGMIYMRGQARDYDGWAELCGDEAWRWEHCLPHFMRHEDHWRGADAMHGAGNEWLVDKQRLSWPILDAFARAATQAGIPPSSDFNRGDNEGVGYFEVNQKGGVRWNTSKAFLRPASGRSNLQVWTEVQATSLLFDGAGTRVTGVDVQPVAGGESRRALAAREVILCAGAIGTPQLLQLSGVGAGAHLRESGVTPRIELPGVGQNLQDHLQIRAVFEVQGAKTLNLLANSWWGKASMALEYLFKRSGPMSMAPSQLGAFTRSSPQQRWPDLEYHVQPLSLDAFGQPLHRFNAFTASVCNLNPSSRGTVQIASPRPQDAPLIHARYLSTAQDRQIAADSLRLTRRIAQMPALAAFQARELKPGVQYQSDEDLARLAGDIGTTIFHPVGTCRMGRAGEAGAVVDSRLRVQGIQGLRIADASVMPTITSGNTNSPTLMIAERAAQWIAQDAAAA